MAVTITASPTIVASTGTETITWSGNTGATNADWFGWFTPGQPDSSGGQGGPGTQWWYTGTTAPSGSMPMPQTPPVGGPYEVRMFSNGGYTRLAVSNKFLCSASVSHQPPDPTPSGLVEEPSEGTQQFN